MQDEEKALLSVPSKFKSHSEDLPSVNQINATHLLLLLLLSFTTKFITVKGPLVSSVSVTFGPAGREKCFACMIIRGETTTEEHNVSSSHPGFDDLLWVCSAHVHVHCQIHSEEVRLNCRNRTK